MIPGDFPVGTGHLGFESRMGPEPNSSDPAELPGGSVPVFR